MSFSLAVWLAVCGAALAALIATFRRGVDSGLLCLRWYFALLLCGNLFTHFTLLTYGFKSHRYVYAYYLTDLAIVVFGFVVLARLVELAFEKSALKVARLRVGAIVLFTGLAVCSAFLVYFTRGDLNVLKGTAYFGMEMEQNFSFLGMILAIILFVGMNVMHVPGLRFRRVVLAFSVLYSSGAVAYAFEAVLPSSMHTVGIFVVPVTSLAGIGLIAYSLWKPERQQATVDARWERALAQARTAAQEVV